MVRNRVAHPSRRRREKILHGQVVGRQLGHDPPPVEHEGAVAHLGHFLEIGGDNQDGGTATQRSRVLARFQMSASQRLYASKHTCL